MKDLISKIGTVLSIVGNKFFSLNKKIHFLFLIFTSVLIVSFTSTPSVFSNDKISGNIVLQNNIEVGYVPLDTNLELLMKELNRTITNSVENSIEITDNFELVEGNIEKSKVVTLEEFTSTFYEEVNYDINVKKLFINDELIGIVSDENTFDSVFEKISSKYKTADTQETTSLDKIVLEDYVLQDEEILSTEELNLLLDKDVKGEDTYTVKDTDTLWTIAENEDATIDELYEMNNLSEDSILEVDQEIIVGNAVPFLDIETKEIVKYEAVADPEIEYIENPDEYITYENVIEEGSTGSKIVTTEITKINGMEETTALLDEEIIVEPTTKVVEIGTSTIPPTKALGTFINPSTYGRLSDYYLARNGRHAGIDIALSYGSNVLASDGGVVSYSGWMNGYGYIVIIDHENGYETRYGHNSSLTVTKGERVYQGQVIAKVGSTGRSSGNHIHFEVRENGNTRNPLNYIAGY